MTAKEKFQVLRHLVLETPLDKQNISELENKFDIYADDIEQALTKQEQLLKELEKECKAHISTQCENDDLKTKHEQLEKDVKRYFELRKHLEYPFVFGSELSLEMYNIRERLEKVGREE